MSRDTIVRWRTESVEGNQPTQAQIEKILTQFFGEVATEVRWDRDRFFVTLVGKWSDPRIGVIDLSPSYVAAAAEKATEDENGRYLEVWPSSDCLYVMTRHADAFTNGCAEQLAVLFARTWHGAVEK